MVKLEDAHINIECNISMWEAIKLWLSKPKSVNKFNIKLQKLEPGDYIMIIPNISKEKLVEFKDHFKKNLSNSKIRILFTNANSTINMISRRNKI